MAKSNFFGCILHETSKIISPLIPNRINLSESTIKYTGMRNGKKFTQTLQLFHQIPNVIDFPTVYFIISVLDEA